MEQDGADYYPLTLVRLAESRCIELPRIDAVGFGVGDVTELSIALMAVTRDVKYRAWNHHRVLLTFTIPIDISFEWRPLSAAYDRS